MTMTDSVAARLKRELLTVKGVTEVNISVVTTSRVSG